MATREDKQPSTEWYDLSFQILLESEFSSEYLEIMASKIKELIDNYLNSVPESLVVTYDKVETFLGIHGKGAA